MARIRSIHPGLFTDEAFVSLTLAARVLLPGVWTECDDHGVFEWKPITLKMKIFPADNVDVCVLLDELLSADLVKKFAVDGKSFGVVRNFAKWQRPKNPSYRYLLPDDYRDYVGLKDDPIPVLPEPSPSPTEIVPQREEGGDSREVGKKEDIRTVAKATRPALDAKFEEFKKAYPRRKGGNPWKPAKAQWDLAIKSGSSPDQIIAAVKAGTGLDLDKRDTEFIPQAVKWLRDRRFDDHALQADNVVPIGFHADFGSDELDAWDAHNRQTAGASLPRDSRGGWTVPARWPPGYEPQQSAIG